MDLDYGDGVGEYFGNSPDGSAVNFSYFYQDPGTYTITGSATNTGEGGVQPLSKQVQVLEYAGDPAVNPSNWTEILLSPANENWGKHHAVALIDLKPAIVYTRDDRDEIYFTYATKNMPTVPADWVSGVVDDADNLGGTLSLCEIKGVPAVSYEDTTMQDVFVAIADSATPTSAGDWAIHRPDTSAIDKMHLANVAGNLHLVYRGLGGKLMYAKHIGAGVPDDPTDYDFYELDTGEQYDYLQLASVDNRPAVAYQRKDGGFNELVYGQAGSSDPPSVTEWDFIVVDDENTNSGNWVRLGKNELGHPVIAYTNVDIVHFLKFAYADTADAGGGLWTPVTVYYQEQTHLGNWLGLGSYNNKPLMTYIETGSGGADGLQVAYGTAAEPAGPADFDRGTIDPGGTYFVNEETNVLILSNGDPAVFYRTSVGLKYMYYTPPD